MGQSSQPGSVALVGGGGHARVVGESAALAGWRVIGVFDDADEPSICAGSGIVRLGPIEALAGELPTGAGYIVSIGNITTRRRVIDALPDGFGDRGANIVHPSAIVSASAMLGGGVFIGPGAIVNACANIGAHAIINTGAIVEHDCIVGAGAHVAPGAVLGGAARAGEDALIGLGARVLPGVGVGSGSVVGAGGVVTRDVDVGRRVVGVPACEMAWAT